MFKTKRAYDEIQLENDALIQQIQELKQKEENQKTNVQVFIKDLTEQLLSVIDQHETVNNQHEGLRILFKKLNDRFNQVESISESSNDNSLLIKEEAKHLITSSEKMVKESILGKESVNKMKDLIESLGSMTQNATNQMNLFALRSQEIDKIILVINSIAEQIQILALNASIEAARAGEYGRGFSVVAEEIRKLADSTAESTQNVASLIRAIQNETNNVLSITKESTLTVNDCVNLSYQTNIGLDHIMTAINDVATKAQDVLKGVTEQTSYNQAVLDEVIAAKAIYGESNKEVLQHIKDAEVVDQRLEMGVKKLRDMSEMG